MKLKMFKGSGELVDDSVRPKYDAEFKEFYDKAEKRANGDMIKLQRYLSFGERQLYKKYAEDIREELPTSAKQWKKLMEKYADTPIMVARRSDTNEVILIIMDNL
jgi:hypothetical protein